MVDQEIVQKIQKVKKNNGKILDLSGTQLSNLPAEIWQLTKHVHDVEFYQIWTERGADIDLSKLAGELAKVRSELKIVDDPVADIAAGEVARAEIEAKNGNSSKVLEYLKKAGNVAWDISKDIGTSLATEALKISMGMK